MLPSRGAVKVRPNLALVPACKAAGKVREAVSAFSSRSIDLGSR